MTKARSVWVLTVMCCGVGLVMAALTTLYSIGPDLGAELGASTTELTWITDVYTLVLVGLLLPAGALGDRYGRREVMVADAVVFVTSAVILQLVDDAPSLIAVRALMGVGAALILPSTLSIITSTFPEDFRQQAVGIWTAAWVMAGAMGMLSAGALLEIFDWHSSFWSLLVGGVVFLAMSLTVPTSRDEQAPPIDVPGSITSVVAMAALVYALIEAGLRGWTDPLIIAAFVVAIAATAAFVGVELRAPQPMLDVRVFALRAFGAASFTVALAFAAVYGLFFLLMQFQQAILGYSALEGVVPICFIGVTTIPITLAAPWLMNRFGLRAMLVSGLVMTSITFWMLTGVATDTSWNYLVAANLVMGVGMGLIMVPCTDVILKGVPVEQAGVGASVNHTTRELGTALGVALFGGLISASYSSEMRAVTEALPEPAREASRDSVMGAVAVAEQSGEQGAGLMQAAQDAFVTATQYTGWVMLVILLVSAVLIMWWSPKRVELVDQEPAETSDQRSVESHLA